VGGKLAAEFDYWDSSAGRLETLLRGRGRAHAGTQQQEVETGDTHQQQGVTQFAAGVNFVAGAPQKFAQVGEYVGIGVEAQNAVAAGYRRIGTRCLVIKGGNRPFLRFVRVEQTGQMTEFQNFAQMFRNVAELHVSARLASTGQAANHRAQAATVNEADIAEMQHDGATVAQQPGYMRSQGLTFAAGNNAPVAANDGDASYLASIERQGHWFSGAGLTQAREIETL